MVMQLVLFTALTGIAMLLDFYFDNNPGVLKEIQACNKEHEKEQGVIYLFSQTVNLNVKTPAEKISYRKFFAQEHDKFIRQCHQLKNHQALKAENSIPRKPLYLSCHKLIFRQNHFSLSDDEPLIS